MRFDVLTLFPEIFSSYCGQAILEKAISQQLVQVQSHNIRDWANDKHDRVDDRPYGGGPGMVMRVDPIVNCAEYVQQLETPGHLILLSPQGRKLDQTVVEQLATKDRLVMICGRYEGFDQRVSDILEVDEISIGDFILNGGEVAAMTIIDAVIRLIPGVLGDEQSSVQDSFSQGNRLLEFPQYTRPREYRGHLVPEILLSGNHSEIEKWRTEQSKLRTLKRRSDLLD